MGTLSSATAASTKIDVAAYLRQVVHAEAEALVLSLSEIKSEGIDAVVSQKYVRN